VNSPAAQVAEILVGLAIVLGTASSVIRTLIVPRALRSLITQAVFVAVVGAFHEVAHRFKRYDSRDALLAWSGPVSILANLVVWLLMFLVGYALLLAGFSDIDYSTALREAGSSLFTLGFASTDRAQLTVVDFVAAATGPIVIGLLVGYLPSLYAAYSRRETEVTLLVARAGEPSWGPEILLRHAIVGSLEELPTLWASWERWAADVSESHTTNPVLVDIRSTKPMRHWLIAILAVMDAAAMQLALRPSIAQGPMRVALRQSIVCVREIAASQGLLMDDDPSPDDPIDLLFEDFEAACALLGQLAYPAERTPAEAWPHFRGWRVNYESVVYALAQRIDAPPALWSGPRKPPTELIPPNRPANRQPSSGGSGPGPWQEGSSDGASDGSPGADGAPAD
jgi:hypothetical protein